MSTNQTEYERKRAQRRASAFTSDPAMERLSKDIREGRLTPSPALRMQVGFYESSKKASEVTR